MATGFQKNAMRIDPYKNYKFQLKWDGHTVLGVMKAGPLKRTTNVITHRSGGENSVDHKTPGRTTYDGLMLERGITWDLDFEAWANKVHPYAGDSSMDLVQLPQGAHARSSRRKRTGGAPVLSARLLGQRISGLAATRFERATLSPSRRSRSRWKAGSGTNSRSSRMKASQFRSPHDRPIGEHVTHGPISAPARVAV